jgi:hypothetical protein
MTVPRCFRMRARDVSSTRMFQVLNQLTNVWEA